jgi:energy-coupling factor transport system permease protein
VATVAPGVTPTRLAARPLPRALHPLAWWLWALGLAVAASRTTNPLLLAAIVGVAAWVVFARRADAPWAAAFGLYLVAAAVIVVVRVAFRILFAGNQGAAVLVPLPELRLPGQAIGLSLFGDVTAESLLAGVYDGLRLATMLVCVGAANALANPRRLLRTLPAALHEVSTAVVVALSVFPQLAESVVRVRRARRLRPIDGEGRIVAMRRVVIPVLEDALDRSLLLASSMDSRGYGRRGDRSVRTGRLTAGLLVAGLGGLCVGVYALLDGTAPRYLAAPFVTAGLVCGVAGLLLAGASVQRSAYRPDRWRPAEFLTAASGLLAGAAVFATSRVDPADLNPSLTPLAWPQLPWLPVLGIAIGLLPLIASPRPPSPVPQESAPPPSRLRKDPSMAS